ncbi:hybrid sensor histidine kinase/response regulator [Pedobacter deserti]|uniref:hybrid sensor histidine kinase/response regulator n=1 Tax=Pedobacter deserti TaxID=2817382 RepID=UPI002109F619|nr:hybrid sensor histidine kinase/response regulator [Pedobacter sp. SYSU D00382]
MEKIKVLLIDDDEDDYVLTKAIFGELADKYELSWVNSYEKGISAIRKALYDVYLVDYRLGKSTGIELLQEAKNSGSEQPVIMLTGKGDRSIDEQAMQYGAADYLVKDEIEADMLDRCIRYSLTQAGILKALKSSERKYRTMFEQAKDPIFISDDKGRIQDMNSGGLRFFGYQHDQISGLDDRSLFRNPVDAEQFHHLLETKGLLSDFECEMVSGTGDVYHCSLSSFIQTDMISVTETYHTIVRDLSYRKQIEDQSVNLGKMAISEHIARGLGDELRDPLSTINLALEELASEEGFAYNESVQRNLEIVRANCDRLNQLIHNFISSTETKTLNLQRHDLSEVIDEALAGIQDLIAGHGIQLSREVNLSGAQAFVDRQKMVEALKIVLVNAVEAMETYPKQIRVKASINEKSFEIAVEDNGPGILPGNRSKIFEPFFTTKIRANGLGLTHAQRLLTTHHGEIRYKALPSGSQFLIQVPVYKDSTLWL